MKISIIVPVYNVAEFVDECIRSVFRQTFRDIELVIVNDCTKDNSMEIIRDILQSVRDTDISVKIIQHERNKGLSAARNTGIMNSSGDYLFFLDSDDKITDNCIELLAHSLKKERTDIVIGDYIVENATQYYPILKLKSSVIKGKSNIVRLYMKERMYPMAWNRLVAKDFITKYGLYFKEGIIHEDVLWTFQCMCKAQTVSIVKEVTYIYRIRENSITSGVDFDENINASMGVIRELIDYALKERLFTNKYVYSYIERRKLELLYHCWDAKKEKSIYAPRLYEFIRAVPRASLWRILIWDFFSVKKLMRDSHYFISSDRDKEEYYWNVPVQTKGHLSVSTQFRFYTWFLMVLGQMMLK